MNSPRPVSRRFDPNPEVVALVARHGAARVAAAYGQDADTVRRYLDGASQRATRWWFELHLTSVAAELDARPKLVVVGTGERP